MEHGPGDVESTSGQTPASSSLWPARGPLVAAAALLLAGFACLFFQRAPWAVAALGLVTGATFFLAGLAMAQRARREPTARLGWQLLAIAMPLATLSQILPLREILRSGSPARFPAPSDLLSLLSLGLVVAGLLAWPLGYTGRTERLRKGLDGLIFGLSLVFIGWLQGAGQAFHSSTMDGWARWAVVAFLLGNATVLGLVVYLGFAARGRFRGPLGWLGMAMSLSFCQAAITIPLGFSGSYYVGHPVDLMVLAAALCVALAPRSPLPIRTPSQPQPFLDTSHFTRSLPYLPLLVAALLGLATLARNPQRIDSILAWLGLATLVLLLGRQYLALRDLGLLSRNLEVRVLERTRALEEAQALLLRTERMNSMASLGIGLAHDINNLLGTIQAQADLILQQDEEGNPPRREDVERMRKATARAADLTGRLMAFGRRGQEPIHELDLVQELRELRGVLKLLLPGRIELLLECVPGPVMVKSSRGRLEQIVVNLVANARDAMPAGGRVVIRLRVADTGSQAYADLEVEDTGRGIPAEEITNIFKPFFTTKAPGVGTGLGLPCVKNLVEQDGGSIQFTSEAGKGTTFLIRLPLV